MSLIGAADLSNLGPVAGLDVGDPIGAAVLGADEHRPVAPPIAGFGDAEGVQLGPIGEPKRLFEADHITDFQYKGI